MVNNKPIPRRWSSLTLAACLAVFAGCAQGQPVKTVTCVPFWKVQVADGLWSARLDANRKGTIPASLAFCESSKRIDNFAIAGKLKEGKFTGLHFNDSDVYKVIEGAAYILKVRPDPKLEKYVDGVIAKFAAAQQSDGYLDTYFTIARRDQRFKHIQHSPRHELYCMGHLIEAGAAHYEVTGKKNLLAVAMKLADHIGSVFGPEKRHEVPEHQQLESALIRLYRATGEKRYLKLGQFFIDQRGVPGRRKKPRAYSQDHMPVRKQSEVVGHAVRAMYNCMGMADLYIETGDAKLLAACRRLWESTTHRKMYVTGGVGATGRGEAFGKDYQLPNASAYAETCAAIGLVFFAHRMWQISPDGEYIDVLERALYNGMLGGVSLAGDDFFYVNRLASTGKGGRGAARRKWFGCACCPSNVCRFIPIVPGYAYGHRGDELYVNMYLPGTARVKMKAGEVTLIQQTRYPWDGAIKITVKPARDAEFTVKVRIPSWTRSNPVGGGLYRYANAAGGKIGLRVNGSDVAMKIDNGYVSIRRKWTGGDTISLALPMPVRRVLAHEKVTANTGRVALQRGPVVYCAEGKDNADKALDIVLDDAAALKSEYRKGLLGGVSVVTGKLKGGGAFVAIPYFARANRGASEMNVWFKRTETPAARPAKK
jgi:hypothetical protein